jgi:O-6-methylguanine DNA methyltransferase
VSKPIVVATLDGPDGAFQVAVSARGVVAAESGPDRDGFTARLASRIGPPAPPDDAARATFEHLRPGIEAILADEARDLRAVPIDLADRPRFDQAVMAAVRDLGWGETASYGEIARRVGTPRAGRAVGGAVGRCPISVLIPCHRVIAADGTLGGYGGDGLADRASALEHKRQLLLREGVTVHGRGH